MEELNKVYPHKVWAGFDWKQAEMYFLCLFSKDNALKQALLSSDFHRFVASLLEDIPMEEVSETKREAAKTLSFNLIYSGFNIGITKGNVLKKRRDLSEEQVTDALEKYQEVFFCLFNWVKQAVVDWYLNQGYMTYFMGAKKFISIPSYLPCEPDKLLNSKQGRLCINTYGQGSVGLLLKYVYSNMFRDKVVRFNTSEHIPIFDSMNFLVDTKQLDSVMEKVDNYATPVLCHNNFSIQMAIDWKLSTKSWGDMKKIKYCNEDKKQILYSW